MILTLYIRQMIEVSKWTIHTTKFSKDLRLFLNCILSNPKEVVENFAREQESKLLLGLYLDAD